MSEETVPRSANGLPPGVPSRVGRYEVRDTLGNGTFGRVYLAFDPEIERLVAVKMPLLPPESQRAFLREARVIADIHHPHVCPVYDAGTHDGLPFIVTRYVKGGTLEQLLGRALPTTAEALRYAEQIARGLDAAHARGVIHRDLKPANVLYDEVSRELVLTDFGIARWLESTTATSGGIKGTPLYMAPEQWEPRGPFGDVSARTDVYSLGVVLFRLLTGTHLFSGGQIQQMVGHCTELPPRPSDVRPNLDTRFDDLCLKALAKQPHERYSSANEFAAAIVLCLHTQAQPPSPVFVPQPDIAAQASLIATPNIQATTPPPPTALPLLHSVEITMPPYGEGITEGVVTAIFVKVGDAVITGQSVVEVNTDKAAVEVRAESDGLVKAIHVKLGDTVPVGGQLLTLDSLVAPEPLRAKADSPPRSAPSRPLPEPPKAVQPPPAPHPVAAPTREGGSSPATGPSNPPSVEPAAGSSPDAPLFRDPDSIQSFLNAPATVSPPGPPANRPRPEPQLPSMARSGEDGRPFRFSVRGLAFLAAFAFAALLIPVLAALMDQRRFGGDNFLLAIAVSALVLLSSPYLVAEFWTIPGAPFYLVSELLYYDTLTEKYIYDDWEPVEKKFWMYIIWPATMFISWIVIGRVLIKYEPVASWFAQLVSRVL